LKRIKKGRSVSSRATLKNINLHEQSTEPIYKCQARYFVRQSSFLRPKHVSSGFPLVFPRNGQVVDLAGQNDAAILNRQRNRRKTRRHSPCPVKQGSSCMTLSQLETRDFVSPNGSVVLSENTTECRIGLLSTAVILLSRATSWSFCRNKKRALVSLLNVEGVEAFSENAG
jgi:hypothetical protein